MHSIVVIDDDKNICSLFEELFKNEYRVFTSLDGQTGLKLVRAQCPDVVLLDVRMPKIDGMQVLKEIKQEFPDMIVIMITATNDAPTGVKAMKLGAYDYVTKPFDIDEIRLNIKNALEKMSLESEVRSLRSAIDDQVNFNRIIGLTKTLKDVQQTIIKVLDNTSTVLIRGESGTGKELVAKSIHFKSIRKDKPFVAVNMAAIPSALLESELFGHEKGSFTGALYKKAGKFEQAHTGTIFLDEIGSLEYPLQAKILRVLQEKEIERVGSQSPVPVDVRVIAATSANLEQLIRENLFRPDLFYRLNVVPISMPPLRDRLMDIPLLVKYFIDETNKKFNKNVQSISPKCIELLSRYDWPGNIRELKNMVERIMVMMSPDDKIIDKKHFPEKFLSTISETNIKDRGRAGHRLEDIERNIIIETYKECGQNVSRAAEILGITRKTLRTKLQKYKNEGCRV